MTKLKSNEIERYGGTSTRDSGGSAWNKLRTIVKLNNNGEFSQSAFEEFVSNINAAVNVEQCTKITVEELTES